MDTNCDPDLVDYPIPANLAPTRCGQLNCWHQNNGGRPPRRPVIYRSKAAEPGAPPASAPQKSVITPTATTKFTAVCADAGNATEKAADNKAADSKAADADSNANALTPAKTDKSPCLCVSELLPSSAPASEAPAAE